MSTFQSSGLGAAAGGGAGGVGGPAGSGASEDVRLQLAIAASNTERRNRPRWMALLGVVLLIAACLYAYWGYSARALAREQLGVQRKKLADVQRVVDEIMAYKAADQRRGFDPNSQVAAKLEDLGKKVDVKFIGPITDAPGSVGGGGGGAPGMTQKKYSARLPNQDPNVMLYWIREALSAGDIPGLELQRLRIMPMPGSIDPSGGNGGGGGSGSGAFSAEVDFARWEKIR